jgi:hypothetical protein
MKKLIPFRLLPVCAILLAGCVSQYKVVVDFSPTLKDYYTEFPTIEVDIAAVTDSEAEEVKQAGVEKYFAPNSGIRERLQSQTCYFYREEQKSFVLPSRAPIWQQWKLKKPANLLVIASLPQDTSVTPETDSRYLLVKMARSYVVARTLNILVEPKKIMRVKKSSSQTDKTGEAPVAAEQWVESRERRK